MPAPLFAKILRNGANGVSSVNSTSSGPFTATFIPDGNGSEGPCFIRIRRSNVYLTASAFTSEPSANLLPARNLKVQTRLSADVVQLSASSPATSVVPLVYLTKC